MGPRNYNFSIQDYGGGMQFYPNIRYPDSEISYRIENCPLGRQDEMESAFDIIGEETILEFYPVLSDEQISVTCDDRAIVEKNLFVAGEGGPTEIVAATKFNVIFGGDIVLLRNSQCGKPNVAIHELLHALGFNHSSNRNNVLYPVTDCSQVIGDDVINLINELYSFPSYPDLYFSNVTAGAEGRYLSTNITVGNIGLKNSQNADIEIYADGKLIKELNLEPIKVGEGKIIILENLFTGKVNIQELEFVIVSSFNELEEENNKIKLKIKS